jgi:hypothetical protein
MRCRALLLVSALLLVGVALSDEGHQHTLTEQEVGSVQFATSCRPELSRQFNRAVALLHSFQYEQARTAFAEIASRDPHCAMAEWGVAMSHYHGLWENGDPSAGRLALNKAQQIAASNDQTTARETAYIDALAEIYGEDGRNAYAHGHSFEQKMAALETAYPRDDEAAIFHALTLAITAPKTDKTFTNQRKCGEILEPIFAKQPHHPGVAHYLIHCYDNPALAVKGLPAARVYAQIAPASSHANHMPSHLFTRVGSWDESVNSNVKSAELAAATEVSSNHGEARDQRLHAMDYLEYAYLQSGRVNKAKAVLDQMNSLPPVVGLTLTGDYAQAAIPARYATELGNWEQACQLQLHEQGVPWAQAITWTAIGIGNVRSKNLERARQAEQKLASLRAATARQNNSYWADQVEVQRLEVAAWIAQESGKSEEALKLARAAADLEESMDKAAVTPGPVTPAREMLAGLLLLEHHPKESLLEYRRVLETAPNRFNALYGAANAAEDTGDTILALNYFRILTEIARGDERPELSTARQKLLAEKAAGTHP